MPVPAVNIVHIVLNEHGPIFADLIALLADGLLRAGADVTISTNRSDNTRINLIVGHTCFLTPDAFAAIERSGCRCVVFQAEVLSRSQGVFVNNPAYVRFLRSAVQVWDYSPGNVEFLRAAGVGNVHYVPIGHLAKLERVVHSPRKDIDVLFYGVLNPRRRKVLDELKQLGMRVEYAFTVYGPGRDLLIARSKVVLNIHQFDSPQLEQLRIAYLLNNRAFVVCETSDHNPYGGGVVYCDYDHIAATSRRYIDPGMDAERARIAEAGYAALKAIPTAESIAAAMQALPSP